MGGVVDDALHPRLPGAMGATVNFTRLTLGPVPEDTAPALATGGRESMGGTLE
jgi:hypothetical protein